MLYLVGTGLSFDELPIGAIDICEKCDEVLAESYTSIIDGRIIARLGGAMPPGKKIGEIGRSAMEENAKELVERAKNSDIAILIGGDPLIATTHKILLIEAKKIGTGVKIVHASSIIPTIIGESGLDFYRFGPACTISRWSEHYKPISFYETLQANRTRNLHTILLLDIDSKTRDSMSPHEAFSILENAELKYKGNIVKDSAQIMIFHNMGRGGEYKKFMALCDLKTAEDKGSNVMLFPAELTDIEKETTEAIFGG